MSIRLVLFFEIGRLGNQLFQYTYLRERYPSARIVIFGCSELSLFVCDDKKTIIFSSIRSSGLLFRLFKLFVRLLCKCYLISYYKEGQGNQNRNYNVHNILYVEGFFQYGTLADSHTAAQIYKSWEKALKKKDSILYNSCFVHVRRGDYLNWPNPENPAVLPDSYYIQAMNIMRNEHGVTLFYIFSDDIKYCKTLFGRFGDVAFVNKSVIEDLQLITNIRYGILSASSLSWWASYLSSKRYADSVYIGPKYWIGHRIMKWNPKSISTDFHSYI